MENDENIPAGTLKIILTFISTGERLESDLNVETLIEMWGIETQDIPFRVKQISEESQVVMPLKTLKFAPGLF